VTPSPASAFHICHLIHSHQVFGEYFIELETMFSGLATKVALKKVGLPSNSLSLPKLPDLPNLPWSGSDSPKKPARSSSPSLGEGDKDEKPSNWPAWMTVKNLPLTVQPWLTPVPPPIPVARPPRIGEPAPLDRDRELTFGGGKKVIVIFLRCVGCACMSTRLDFTPISCLGPGFRNALSIYLSLTHGVLPSQTQLRRKCSCSFAP